MRTVSVTLPQDPNARIKLPTSPCIGLRRTPAHSGFTSNMSGCQTERVDVVATQYLEDTDFFDSMLSLVPAGVYFQQDAPLSKFAHKKSGSVAVEHKLKKRRMNMSKREKLEKKPTISEMQESALKIQEEAEANAPDSEQQPAEELGIDELKEKLHSRLSTFKDNRTRSAEKPPKRQRSKSKKEKPAAAPAAADGGDVPAQKPEPMEIDDVDAKPASSSKSSEPDIVFGNIEMTSGDDPESMKKKQRLAAMKMSRKTKGGKVAKLQKALEKAEKNAKRSEELTDQERQQKNEKLAVMKASGIKVIDDAKLIKKSIKREQAKKSKKSKNWSQRQEKLEKECAEAGRKIAEKVMDCDSD